MAEVRVKVRGGTREWQWFLLMLPIRDQGLECASIHIINKGSKNEQAIRCTKDLGHDEGHGGYARNLSDWHVWPRHEIEMYVGRQRFGRDRRVW